MGRNDALQGTLPLLLLTVLDRRGPLHGYGITLQIEGMSDNVLRVEEGSLYPALHRMEEGGWIKAKWARTETGRRARMYESRPPDADSSRPKRPAGARSPQPWTISSSTRDCGARRTGAEPCRGCRAS